MEVKITARHAQVSEAVRAHTQERVQRLQRLDRRPTHAEILFDKERDQKKVEIRLVVTGGSSFIAEAFADNYRTAVDTALDRLTRQMKREHEKERDHQAPKLMP